jgi:hypothetical protein
MHLVMNFVYLRSYMLKLFAFCLDSCVVNKGEKFVHDMGTWEHWKVFKVVRAVFEKFGAGPVSWGGLMPP